MSRLALRPDEQLTYVVWELTLRCDLACTHCGSRAGRPRTRELDRDEALGVVAQLADMGAAEVTLIGGEAYLHEAWTDVARAIASAGMSCTIVTGGRGMTPERARQARDAGVDMVSVSIDGLAARHDTLRGLRGSFDAALAALDNLRAAGVRIAANTQINRLTRGELADVLDLVIARGCTAWQVALTVPMGRAADRPELILQPYELLDAMPVLAALSERAGAAGVALWPGNNVGYFGPYDAALRGTTRAPTRVPGCTAGAHLLGIESDGAIKGCPSLPSAGYVAGNVRERSIRDLWDNARELRYTRDRTTADLWGYCRECITPTRVAAAARGRVTCSSVGRGTIRFVTIARSSSRRAACASGSYPSRARPACRSITACSSCASSPPSRSRTLRSRIARRRACGACP